MTDTAPRLIPLAVYTSDEAASILRVSLRKLREMTKTHELHALPYATGKLLVRRSRAGPRHRGHLVTPPTPTTSTPAPM